MKFYGEPNQLIFMTVRKGLRKDKKQIGQFDSNGTIEIEDKVVIDRMKLHFRYEDTIYHCKKCEFQTSNKGDLMVHYKAEHPKPKK